MEAQELRIDEAEIRELIDWLAASGVPQTLDVLTEWYIEVITRRASAG